jgi:hypothetical protein
MSRSPVVTLLMMAIFLAGCAAPAKDTQEKSWALDREEQSATPPPQKRRSFGQWLNDHPFVKYGGLAVLVAIVIVLGVMVVEAIAVVGLLSHLH